MSKIQNIDHCWECKEHYDYGGNNLDRCGETGKLLSDIEVIPTWCPLPDKAGWLPIESAPKDGTHILLYRPDIQFVGYYNAVWHINAPGLPAMWPLPTHWMPLPSPPETTK